MTETAVRHAEGSVHAMPGLMAAYAIEHGWQAQRGQTGAGGHGGVTGDAVQLLRLPGAEVSQVREFDARPHARGHLRRQPRGLAGWALDSLRRMAAAAIARGGGGAQVRADLRPDMASGALRVLRKGLQLAIGGELVAVLTIRSKPRARIHTALLVDVARVRELGEERPLSLETGEGLQIVRARRRRGRVALLADARIVSRAERHGVAHRALAVSGPAQRHRILLHRDVALAAIEFQLC